jgi:hypothetical protein
LPAEVQRGEADFRQLHWSDASDKLGGGFEAIVLDSSGIAPLYFRADQNIGPTIWDRHASD